MSRKTLQIIALFLTLTASVASAQMLNDTAQIRSVIPLPITTMQAVETPKEVFFMSSDGRYVFRGAVIDTWHKKKLRTASEVRYSANHIDLRAMGLDINRLNKASLGTGSREVTVFVDPLCNYCKSLIKEAKNHGDEYTFHFVIVPALGDRSNELAKKAFCSSEPEQVLDGLVNGTMATLLQKSECDKSNYDFTLTLAQMLGIKSVPYTIADDGRYRYGGGQDYWAWLSDSK